MHAVVYEVEIRIPDAHSLKDRRQVVRSVLAVTRERFHVSAAEVGRQDTWQRGTLGFAVVASDVRIAEQTVDEIDRYLWSRPELEVLDGTVHWLEEHVTEVFVASTSSLVSRVDNVPAMFGSYGGTRRVTESSK